MVCSIPRPALGHKRVRTSAGKVVLQLKPQYRYGTIHLVMTRWNSCNAWLPSPHIHGSI